MKKIVVLLALFTVVGLTKVAAQDYNWAIGVRGGITASGITVKHNFDPSNSIEGIVDFAKGFNVYALYERNIPVITSGFHFYYGAGANLGAWKRHDDRPFTVGIDGVVGLEYKIQTIPLAFSVDYKPCLNFVGRTGFFPADFGLSIKVAF